MAGNTKNTFGTNLSPDPIDQAVTDYLGYEGVAKRLSGFIVNKNESETLKIAITAPWGTGKTQFLLLLQEALIKDISAKTLESKEKKSVVYRFNAWECDQFDEPLIALIGSLIEKIDPKENLLEELYDCLKLIKFGAIELSKDRFPILHELTLLWNTIRNKRDYKEILQKYKKARQHFHQAFKQLVEPFYQVIILVDELDRCNPMWAIKLLERMYHLMTTSNTVFVIGCDIDQLANSIQGAYGQSFDGKTYLKRFFDFEFGLNPDPDPGLFHQFGSQIKVVRPNMDQVQLDNLSELLAIFVRCELDTRAALQIGKWVATFYRFGYFHPSPSSIAFAMYIKLCFPIEYKNLSITNPEQWRSLVRGGAFPGTYNYRDEPKRHSFCKNYKDQLKTMPHNLYLDLVLHTWNEPFPLNRKQIEIRKESIDSFMDYHDIYKEHQNLGNTSLLWKRIGEFDALFITPITGTLFQEAPAGLQYGEAVFQPSKSKDKIKK